MKKSIPTWSFLLSMLFLAACTTPAVDLPSPTNPPLPATGTAPGGGMLPGSPGETSEVPLPVIVLTPLPQNSIPIPEAVMTPATAEQSEQVRLATEDLMQRINVLPEEISLVDVANVVWSDGSMGCPQPGMFYTQALVEGLRIRLQVGEVIYHYHSGRNQAPFLCENPSGETGLPSMQVTE